MDISPQITIYIREISLGCSLSQFLKNFICFAGWYYLIFILSSYDSFFSFYTKITEIFLSGDDKNIHPYFL